MAKKNSSAASRGQNSKRTQSQEEIPSSRSSKPKFTGKRSRTSATQRNSQRGADRTSSSNDTCAPGAMRDRVKGMNDISWYTRYPEIIADTARFPYPYRPGMELPVSRSISGYPTVPIPGVMVFPWAPYIGYSSTNTDPASVVCKQIYDQVRKVYSGSLDADAPDFIIYLAALDSVFAYIAWLKRVYRVLRAYSPNNYATPDLVLQGMGFTDVEISNLRAHIEQFHSLINTLVYQTRKFTCPAAMDIFNRHYWMSDNIYTDAPSPNSQFFMFNLCAVYYYVETDTPDGIPAAGLRYRGIPTYIERSTPLRALDLYSFGEDLISALAGWDDSYTISGYLSRAYDGHPSFVVDMLADDEVLEPVYNEEVLSQIENSRGIGYVSSLNSFNLLAYEVSQDPKTNTILSGNEFTTNAPYTENDVTYLNDLSRVDPMLSIRSDSPTVADNIIATRLINMCEFALSEGTGTSKPAVVTVQAGTELVFPASIYLPGGTTYVVQPAMKMIGTELLSQWKNNLGAVLTAAQFDWAPGSLVIYNNGTSDVNAFWSRDLHNATIVSTEEMIRLHTQCLFRS